MSHATRVATGLALERLNEDAWFNALDPAFRTALLRESTPLSLAVGEFVFRHGDPPNGFFCIVEGTLKVSTLREDGKEAILGALRRGQWFGEASMLDGLPRTHDVSAIQTCRLLHLSVGSFERLIEDAKFARAMGKLLSLHTRVVYELFQDATLRTTRARVARRLRRMMTGYSNAPLREGQRFPITQQDLAMMLGISRQTLGVELKAMTELGVLTLGYGTLTLRSAAKLSELEQDI